MTYGESLGYCIRHDAAFRFINRRERGEFLAANMSIPGDYALEMAIGVHGQTVIGYMPLDSGKEPSRSVAEALIGCVEWFVKREQQSLVVGGGLN